MWLLPGDKASGSGDEDPCESLEKRIKERVTLDGNAVWILTWLGGTIDAIFIVRQIQGKVSGKRKRMAFVDLAKAFDRVPREIVWWALEVVGVDEWIVKAIQAMYDGATTAVRLRDGESKEFGVKVGLHQGSVLSPLLFTIVLEALSKEFRCGLPWELLYAFDLDPMAELENKLMDKFELWRSGLEDNGLRVGSQVASGRVVYVVKGLAETQFFALSVVSGHIKDVVE